jgi:hypothetical protein
LDNKNLIVPILRAIGLNGCTRSDFIVSYHSFIFSQCTARVSTPITQTHSLEQVNEGVRTQIELARLPPALVPYSLRKDVSAKMVRVITTTSRTVCTGTAYREKDFVCVLTVGYHAACTVLP